MPHPAVRGDEVSVMVLLSRWPVAFTVVLSSGISVAPKSNPAVLASSRLSTGFVGVGVLGVRLGRRGEVVLIRRRCHAGVPRSDEVHHSSSRMTVAVSTLSVVGDKSKPFV